MDDNTRPNRTAHVQQLPEREDTVRMEWLAFFPDLNTIEHVWDALSRHLVARLHPSDNTQQLKQMLIEE
ncbi:transposable element Tcb2 transposase [Trichonephila clavipes]|nr:transposable element Tcb2 transposase [Trichonephila clavipes]